jgi:uncharacterized protein YukE
MGGEKMSKAIERRMVLRDQVTPTMSKINKNTLTYKKHLKTVRNEGNKTWRGLRGGMMGVVFAGLAMAKSVLAVRDLEQAYIDQSQAVTKLNSVFRATGKASEAEVASLEKYAGQLQNVGVIGDEVTLSGMQQLATFNVTSSTIETLSGGMLDLVAQQKGLNATQGDAVNIANMVGKAMTGQVGALSRVGISFTEAQGQVLKYGSETEKAAVMAQVLQQNVGGVNAALANTDEGRIVQVKNAVGDLQERLGRVVVRVKGAFASAFNDNFPVIEAKVNAVSEALNKWVDTGGARALAEDIGLVVKTVNDLAPAFALAAGGLAAYKVYATYAWIAQIGLNAAMAANPVGFVITVLAALVTAVSMVRIHQDLLKVSFMKAWNGIATVTTVATNAMIGDLNTFLSGAAFLKNSVVHLFQNMWNVVVSMAENRVRDWVAPINAVLRALEKEEITVDFSAAKIDTVAPTYARKDYIREIQVKRFSDDTISAIEESRARKQQKDVEDNTAAMTALAETLDSNTDAVSSNTKALKASSRDMTGEEIADKLLPRLERVVYG